MKRYLCAVSAVVLLSGVVGSSSVLAGPSAEAPAAPAAVTDGASSRRDFDHFLESYEAANSAFVNGDPEPWLAMTAENDPASIFGGFGGLGEAGVAEVHQRYLLAANVFRPSGAEVDFEYLVKDVQGRTRTRSPSSAPTCCTQVTRSCRSRSCESRCCSASSGASGRSSTATPT